MGAAESKAPSGGDFAELFEHEGILRAAAANLCRKQWETDDLVQDTFERALRFLQAGNPRPAHLRAWLVSILRNAFIDRIRRRAVTFEPLAESGDARAPAAPESEPEPAWAGVSIAEVRAALGALDADQRQAFELHYLEGLSYRDVAERMSIPQNTVASRLFRARKALRRVLDAKLGGAT
jgi:RNA polymerase sigma-70 factor, ECF subfamily